MSILDWGLLTKLFPPVAGALNRINRQWGNMLQFRGTDERANGIVALGVCGLRPFPRMDETVAVAQVLSCVDAFLVMELLGQALPFRLAGRVLDSFGDVVRGGLKRLRGSDEEQVASVTLGGHRFFLALRRGAMILATSRHALMEARDMMESGAPEILPPGLLLRSECDARRFGIPPAGRDREGLDDGSGPAGLLEEMRQLGAVEWEVRRVPAGLRLGLQFSLRA